MVNKKQDKNYSFRQRRNNNSNFTSFIKSTNKSELKSEITKSKTKAAPLSKYRRKTANARERTRMREINTAFENLRKCVPISYNNYNSSSSSADDQQSSANEKLTKITTLRLAMMYIRTLSDALINNECHTINFDTDNNYNYYDCNNTKLNNCDSKDEEMKLINRNNIEEIPKKNKIKKNDNKKKSILNVKRNYKHRKINSLDEHNYSDITSYSLESDGESLNFSEETDSPIQHILDQTVIKNKTNSCYSSSSSLIEEPLDLVLPNLNDGSIEEINEEVDFTAPFLTPTDLDCIMHPFTDLFSDLTAESTLDYLI